MNIYGQLGLKETTIGVTLEPKRVDFTSPKEKILDIACGFNHCVALNDNKLVYVWGKRMGMYPSFENESIMVKEINQDTPR